MRINGRGMNSRTGRRAGALARARAKGTRAWVCLIVLAAAARARGAPTCRGATSATTVREDANALTTKDEIDGRGGAPYDPGGVFSSVPRCFSNFVFEGGANATGRWMLMSWPSGSALTNATSYANATFDVDGSVRATLRPDVEGVYSAALVDDNGCYASDVLEVSARWTCEPASNNAIIAVFIAFAVGCAFWFGSKLESSNFESERNVLFDVRAAFAMVGGAKDQKEVDDKYERELRETTQTIESEHLAHVTRLDLQKDLKDMFIERKRAAREREAKAAGMWNPAEEAFQRNLYNRERALRRRTKVGEQIAYNFSKSIIDVRYAVILRRARFSIWFHYHLSQMTEKAYWCQLLLRFQLQIEFLALTAFAWRRASHSNEMYRDGVADVIFYPALFGPGMKDVGAASRLSNWFVVLLLGIIICPALVQICRRAQRFFDKRKCAYAEFVEIGGDKNLGSYSEDPDIEVGGDAEEQDAESRSLLGRVLGLFASFDPRMLFNVPSVEDIVNPVRNPEKYRRKIVSDHAWAEGSEEAILRAVRSQTSSPINLRLIPRRAAERMETMAKLAIDNRRKARICDYFAENIAATGFVLRVFILRVALMPMLFTSLGFLMVTTSFVPTPWVHVSKDPSASFGDSLYVALLLGFGAIAVSMSMAAETESIELDLRPVPIFEIVSVLLKVVLASVVACMEAEIPSLGVPALDAESRLLALNTFRNFLPILVCGASFIIHFNIQSLRGFARNWNAKRSGGLAGAAVFAISTFAARSFNTPPWGPHYQLPHSGSENWARPGVIVGIIVAFIASTLARVLNATREEKCLRNELLQITEPGNIGKIEEVLTPEFITGQVESGNRRDRVTALVAFYSLLSAEQRSNMLTSLVQKTRMPTISGEQDDSGTDNDADDDDDESAWDDACDAFEEIQVIMSCISDDPEQECIQAAGEEFIKTTLVSYIEATVEITLWCREDGASLAYGAVLKLVNLVKNCISSGETRTFQAAIASVAMECIQSMDFAYLMATTLFNAHDIQLDMDGNQYLMSGRSLRQMIDALYDITPRPVAERIDRVITHVRDPNTDEVRALDRVERVNFIARTWLRPDVKDEDRPELNWLSYFGYYAAVGKLQADADEERRSLANDFMETLLGASLSTDEQIAFFAIRTVATVLRVGGAASSIFAVGGLRTLFECRDAFVGTAKEIFVSEIFYRLTNDAATRSELLTALAIVLVESSDAAEKQKIDGIELMNQTLKLEIETALKISNGDFEEATKYKASISTDAARYAHDALYGLLVDGVPDIREHAIYVLVDLITLFVWGSQDKFYIFKPPTTKQYHDAAFTKFLDETRRKMPGGALMATSMHRHLYGKHAIGEPQRDADKLFAVLLKIFNTDSDARVRTAAENGLSYVKSLMSEDQASEALALYDEKSDSRNIRGAAPSREVLREVRAAIHSSVERQHQKDETVSKLRMNEFWRKMKDKREVSASQGIKSSTKGGKVEITRKSEATESTPRVRQGGRVPLVKESVGFRNDARAPVTIVRHPQPQPPHEAIKRQQTQRSDARAKRLAAREAASERWYGGQNFKRDRATASESAEGQDSASTSAKKQEVLNKKKTITAQYGMSIPKEFKTVRRRVD